ncbi:MAG: hypothetical protein ACRYG2_38110 [Janthinobacterium lividum]
MTWEEKQEQCWARPGGGADPYRGGDGERAPAGGCSLHRTGYERAGPGRGTDVLPNPLDEKQQALREQALNLVLTGQAKVEKINGSSVVKVGHHVNGRPSYVRGQDAVPTFDDTKSSFRAATALAGVRVADVGVTLTVQQQQGTSVRVGPGTSGPLSAHTTLAAARKAVTSRR